MLNNVVLIGRLTKDPELRYTAQNAKAVVTFTLACQRPFKNQAGENEVDFINIVTWNNLAEHCAKYLQKGSMCAVVGRLQIRSYEDSEGIQRKVSEVVAENVRFLSKTKQQNEENEVEDDAGEEEVEF